MKILQINAVYGFGSTGVIVRDIEQQLLKQGHEALIAYQFAESLPEKGCRVGNRFDWKWHALYTRLSGKQGYVSKLATKKFIAYLQKESPDVVHLHNLHSNYINLPMLLEYLAAADVHTVLTLHDCWFFTGKCCHFTAVSCERWQSGCGDCPLKKASPASWFIDNSASVLKDRGRLFQNIKKLTVAGCSDWICSLAKESPVFKGKDVVRIYNGVDTDLFKPMTRDVLRRQLGLDGKFVILGMANKFFNPANSGIANDLTNNLSSDEHLLIVGCNEQQQHMLQNNPKVSAFGYIRNREKLAEIYNIADVFINLTLEDTLPTVNMESICCGTPVITYDSCGSPELIKENETGYIIQKFDCGVLKQCCKKVKTHCDDMRKACVYYGKKNFDKTNQYLFYLKLYQNIING